MIDRGSLTGTLGAYLTGAAVTSAPWLLTTVVLVGLRLAARGSDMDFTLVERTVTVVYALAVILSAPIDVVISRYTSDRLYDRRLDAIGAPLRRGLAATIVGFAAAGAGAMALLHLPLSFAIPGAGLTAVVGAEWLMLSVGGGLSSPGVVLRAFALGAPVSLVGAIGLARVAELGPLGFIYGLGIGQLVTLVLLLVGVARVLPPVSDERARLLPSFIQYRLLALSAFAYHLSIWADKPLVWALAGRAPAALYTASAALAWFSVIPAFAWIYVQVETVFYQRYRAFYGALESGGSLPRLRETAEVIRAEAFRILRGAALVQLGVTAVAFTAGPALLRLVGLPPQGVPMYRMALVGAALQLTTLLSLLMLYYFDLRREALAVALSLLAGELVFTFACWELGAQAGSGYVLGCAASCVLGIALVRTRMRTLLIDTFQSQPYGVS